MCLEDAKKPSFVAYVTGVAHGLVKRPLPIQEVWILCDHGRDDIVVGLLTGNFPVHEFVLVEKPEVVFLPCLSEHRQLPLFCHGYVEVLLCGEGP